MKLPKVIAGVNPVVVVLIVLVAALAYYLYRAATAFDVKPYEGFDNGAAADGELYFVYATWCPHCKEVLPAMKELAAKSPVDVDGKKVRVVLVESEEKEKIAALPIKVEGFPTFFFKKADGSVHEYSGERTPEALMEFVKTNLS